MKIPCWFTNVSQGMKPIKYFVIDFKLVGYVYHVILINEYGHEFKIMTLEYFTATHKVDFDNLDNEQRLTEK